MWFLCVCVCVLVRAVDVNAFFKITCVKVMRLARETDNKKKKHLFMNKGRGQYLKEDK